jgi:hypothetical protein
MHYDILIAIVISTVVATVVARVWADARRLSNRIRNGHKTFETWAKCEGYAWDRDLKGQYRSHLTRRLWDAFNLGANQ